MLCTHYEKINILISCTYFICVDINIFYVWPSFRFVSVHVTQVSKLDDVMIDGLHMWPLVYYCLRCGDIPAALHCVKLAG